MRGTLETMAFNGRDNGSDQANPFWPFFRQLWEKASGMIEPNTQVRAQGSGFLVSDDGYIITDSRVVNDAAQVEVATSDGVERTPRKSSGLTRRPVLKIDGAGYSFVHFADKGATRRRLGDRHGAIRSAYQKRRQQELSRQRGATLAQGRMIVSIQIDAPINHCGLWAAPRSTRWAKWSASIRRFTRLTTATSALASSCDVELALRRNAPFRSVVTSSTHLSPVRSGARQSTGEAAPAAARIPVAVHAR